MEQLQFVLPESIEWSYDEEGDVLYCAFNKPEPAIMEDLGNGLLARFREKDGALVGLTIIGVRDILKDSKWESTKTG